MTNQLLAELEMYKINHEHLNNLLEEKDKEIERLTAESTEWESKCYKYQDIINELTDLLLIKRARAQNEKDYSRYYVEGFNRALLATHSTPDGIMLETIKSTTIKLCSELLDKLKELKEGK